jgi:microcystin-dependent protein
MTTTTNGDLRPARLTPNLDLPVPGDAAPMDPPTDIGKLADVLDAMADRLRFQPGDLKFSAAEAPGPGWLLCDGRAVGRSAYPELFQAIGTAHGQGDGSETFNLPDLRDRTLVGASATRPLGTRFGQENVTLTLDQMPHHAHTDLGHGHGVGDPGHLHAPSGYGRFDLNWANGGNNKAIVDWGGAGQVTAFAGTGIWIGAGAANIAGNGGGQPHSNVQPGVAVNVFVKT